MIHLSQLRICFIFYLNTSVIFRQPASLTNTEENSWKFPKSCLLQTQHKEEDHLDLSLLYLSSLNAKYVITYKERKGMKKEWPRNNGESLKKDQRTLNLDHRHRRVFFSSHHRGSRCPPGRSWPCDLQPPLSRWGWADRSGWTPRCCGSVWKQCMEETNTKKKKKTQLWKELRTAFIKTIRVFLFQSFDFILVWNMTAINVATVPWSCQTGVMNSWERLLGKGKISLSSCVSLPRRAIPKAKGYQNCKWNPVFAGGEGSNWVVVVLLVLGHRTTAVAIRTQASVK